MAKRTQAGNRAVCYTRVSTVEQWKFGFSLDAQEERLRAYCRMAGLEVAELIREEGVSASISLAKRPAGAKLLELVIPVAMSSASSSTDYSETPKMRCAKRKRGTRPDLVTWWTWAVSR